MSLDALIAPLVAAIAIFGTAVVLDARTVFIKSIDVPVELWSTGFSSEVMEEELANAMLDIEREGRARASTRPLAIEAGTDPVALVTQYFGLTPLLEAFQQSGGFVAFAIDGYVTQADGSNVLQLDFAGRDGSDVSATVKRPLGDVPGLVRAGAEAIMRVVEPEPLCASYLSAALESGGGLDRAESCVRDTLPTAMPRDQVWLQNLAGVIGFLKGDQVGAMDRFRRALQMQRDFSPALLNVGVLLALNDRPAEAVKAYEYLFADLDDGNGDRTYAAAYAEWAKSLAALGRTEEAAGALRRAIAVDPTYADSYAVLSGLLPPGEEADRLRRRGEEVARTRDQLYTENLVGQVFDAGKARLQPL